MKKKIISILLLLLTGSLIFSGCSKDQILDNYNTVIRAAGNLELTGDLALKGTRKNGVDHFTGTYQANYKDFSNTEYLFGGTFIEREAGDEITVTCTLEVTDGTAIVFWNSGSDEPVTLLDTDGTYTGTLTLPAGGNYIGIECEGFSGSIDMSIE